MRGSDERSGLQACHGIRSERRLMERKEVRPVAPLVRGAVPRADGEPSSSCGGWMPYPGHRHSRAGGGAAALLMLDHRSSQCRITLGADRAYDVYAFTGLRARRITPHAACILVRLPMLLAAPA
jgi:hypothetical protein